MANSRGQSIARNMVYNGRHSLLPLNVHFQPFIHHIQITSQIQDAYWAPKRGNTQIYRDVNSRHSHHQRASSEILLIEEQPSWLDELLNEPATPVQRGHIRASTDSFMYLEAANVAVVAGNIEYGVKDEHRVRNLNSITSWGSQDFDLYKDAARSTSTPFYVEPNAKSRAGIHRKTIIHGQLWSSKIGGGPMRSMGGPLV